MAKSRKNTTKSTSRKAKAPARNTAEQTRVRRVESDAADNGSPLKGAIIIALLVLGLWLLFSMVSGWRADDQGDAAKTDEEERVEEREDAAKNAKDDKKDTDKQPDQAEGEQSTETSVRESDTAYDYTVGSGESYTTMARRAVASADDQLSPAERVAAETKLVQDSGATALNLGQELSLSKADVEAAVKWAKGLSAEQKAAWQPYADLVAW